MSFPQKLLDVRMAYAVIMLHTKMFQKTSVKTVVGNPKDAFGF